MKTAGIPISSFSRPNIKDFNLTIIDSRILPARLATEVHRVYCELRRDLPELRRNPIGFGRQVLSKSLLSFRRSLNDSNSLTGFTSAALLVASFVALAVVFDKRGTFHPSTAISEDATPEIVEVLKLSPREGVGGGIDKKAVGRVGLRTGKGEGSGPTPTRAQGGGSGGMGDKLPTQRGALPPPSSIPAPIPKQPRVNASTLPAAGIDIDPLLWTDVKYPVFGDPRSRSEIPSNGPGRDGGMGSNRGFGVGDGRDNGFGNGTGGNTGNGSRQIGGGGVSGAPAGTGDGRDVPLRSNEVEQKVRLLSKPEPHYSEEARRKQIMGTVVLRVVFARSGEVTQIRAVSTLPFGLTERAIAAARQIKFLPAMKGGHAVSVHMQLEYNFNLY